MNLKDLAIVIWACARIKLPKSSNLPTQLNARANFVLIDCIQNQFLFNWKAEQAYDSLSNFENVSATLNEDMNSVLGSDALHEKHKDQDYQMVSQITNEQYEDEPILEQDLGAESVLTESNEDTTTFSHLNSQAFGMIYWGLAKIMRNPRQKFHK